ncbi:MAG: NB-ARC domain-containing protein, partial [Actinomycetota bacterium]
VGPGAAVAAVRTFVMTDLEGSTRRWEDDDRRMAETLEQHDELLTEVFEAAGGSVFKNTGDGVCVAFTSTGRAVEAAVEAQRRIQRADWPAPDRPRVRVGIDMGEAVHRDGDWFGKPLNRTARVMQAAAGDQILSSAVVAEMAALDLDGGPDLDDLGLFRLPDLAPMRLFRVSADDLASAAGPPREPRVSGQALGQLRTRTYGREAERSALADDLGREQLVTVVGPGGAGKTHLARQVGADLVQEFTGGAWVSELGKVTSAEAAAQEILTSIGGLRHSATSVTDSITRTLDGRRVLVVLDNCEHVIEGLTPVIEQVLTDCPRVALLATSREPLGVDGELVRRIQPLDREAATALFVAEARRHGRDLDPADPAIDRICGRLDDLPMAVRLAAARARSLDLPTIEALLADRFDNLRALGEEGLEHQRTLRATIAWSVNALDRPTRAFLAELSVFADRFGVEDVRAVSGADPAEQLTMLDDLVQRSLLIGPEPTSDGVRYRLLESVRIYAREHLDAEVRDRHLDHLLARVAVWSTELGSKDSPGSRHFERRWDDLRVAFDHAVASGRDGDAVVLLARAATYGGLAMRFEMLDWYARVLDGESEDFAGDDEARAHAGWSVLATYHGDFDLAADRARAVVAAKPDLAEGAWAMAWLPWTRGELDPAREWLDRVIDNP